MIEFLTANMAPMMFGLLVVFPLSGFPVAFALAANGIFFGIHRARHIPPGAAGPAERVLGIMANDTPAGDPLLHLHGHHPRTQRHGRTCSNRRDSSSARSAAASPTR